ncbi:MAG: DUF559 domain-containing protein [Micropruina sp.]|uniref:endonuclease domain-containing protein n=1 Tax=Micropruina sp. TaxID=2737536 RepID=UPI0039E4141C
MDDLDDLMTLTTVMALNNGVLRRRDHRTSRAGFDRLVRSGAIVRVLPGTFVNAQLITSRLSRCAAALATYPGSLLWGTDAVAALTRTLDKTAFGRQDTVGLAHPQSRYAAPGVRWTRRTVPAEHRVRIDGLRCASASYLAVEAAARDQGAMIERFLRAGLVKPAELSDVLPALASTKGHRERCRVVRASQDNPWSGGERRLQALLRKHRITGWVANAELMIDSRRCFPDVLFEAARLVLEFDGYGVHTKPEVFESDRRRQNALVIGDYRVLRYTWKQLTEDPDTLIAEVRTLMARQITSDPDQT